MDKDERHIRVEIADKTYGLWIERNEETEFLVREAAKQIRRGLILYRQEFDEASVDTKDLLAMVALQLSINNLQLKNNNDTAPFEEKIRQLNDELESFLDK